MQILQSIKKPDGFTVENLSIELEKHLAAHIGALHSLVIDNLEEAISMTLSACGITSGSPVLCAALERPDILAAIESTGAVPVLVDINPNTLNIDPYCLNLAIRKYAREKKQMPKALFASDTYGLPFNYASISAMCADNGISLIENMSGAFGASTTDIPAGHSARFSIAELFDNATQSGFGKEAAIFCDSQNDYDELKKHRLPHAVSQDTEDAIAETDKYSVQCSLIKHTVTGFTDNLETRNHIASWYRDGLYGYVRMQEPPEGYTSSYHRFAILARDEAQRDNIIGTLSAENIPFLTYAAPLRDDEPEWQRIVLVNAKRVSSRLVLLPVDPYMCRSVVDHICSIIKKSIATI